MVCFTRFNEKSWGYFKGQMEKLDWTLDWTGLVFLRGAGGGCIIFSSLFPNRLYFFHFSLCFFLVALFDSRPSRHVKSYSSLIGRRIRLFVTLKPRRQLDPTGFLVSSSSFLPLNLRQLLPIFTTQRFVRASFLLSSRAR